MPGGLLQSSVHLRPHYVWSGMGGATHFTADGLSVPALLFIRAFVTENAREAQSMKKLGRILDFERSRNQGQALSFF